MAGKDGDDEARLGALFGGPPEAFVAERDRWARELRDAGDRPRATEVKALRRPTQSAWLVNLLVRDRADVVDGLLTLGESLREAQTALDGDALRALSAQRRSLVDALVRDAVRLGTAAGARTTAETRNEIGATLEAALVDPDVAEQVRAARLSSPVSRSGFGGPEATAVLARTAPHPVPARTTGRAAAPPKEKKRKTAENEPAKRAYDVAERKREAAQQERDAQAKRVTAAETAVAELTQRLGQLRAQVADVERRLADASLELRHGTRERDRTQRSLDAAVAAANRARARLERG